jgi:tetratricopeptide (TPR) repeat protein
MIQGRRLVVGVIATLICLAAAIGLQIRRDRLYPRENAEQRALLYVRSPEALRRIALSFDALLADVYWIRALQHYGGDRRDTTKQRKYVLLAPLLDLTTSLDPYFTIAYRFGAIFLSEPYPGGGGRPDQAIALLRKGIAVQPTKWQYFHDIAFVHYWQLRDMEAAASWFRRAAALPNAPNWLEPVAATMLLEGGDREAARFLLREILKSEEAWLRRMAARGLAQVDALDWIDQLQRFVAANPPPSGESYSWESYVRRRRLRDTPRDPAGTPFAIDSATGAVTVSTQSELYPMPTRRGK